MSKLGAPFEGIEPIEVWDLPVAGKTLQHWRDSPELGLHLATVVLALRDEPPSTFTTTARTLARRIERVHLVGGAADTSLAEALRAAGLPCSLTSDAFAAARAGARHAGGRCVDVGQTAIKIIDGDRAFRIPRDLSRAPMRDETRLDARTAARASTIAFLAEAIASHPPISERVLLGLPCERTAEGHPRSCTYAWPDPDPALLPELAARTRRTLLLANDAELAALAAREQLTRGPVTLVLTIGFAVGGALLT